MIKVDFEETLQKNKLVRVNYYPLGTMYFYATAIVLLFGLFVCRPEPEFDTKSYQILYWLFMPVFAILILALLYKKATETEMRFIASPFSTDITKEIVNQYFLNNEYSIEYSEGNNVIATEGIGLFGEMQITIVFIDDGLMLNVFGRNITRFHRPLLLADREVRKDIEFEIKYWGKPKGQYLET